MPKKAHRHLDRYYVQAKLEGYRARSAYKLIQLNHKYGFLQKSLVCVDLCAAPGSWMQVAKKYMPLSSLVVGVDLYPIPRMQGAISIVGDITTDKVRQELKATLKTWKADLVLHDGAPNVGQNWLHDAYQQNVLTLHAFRLACELLQKNGTFLTKVFRSKDYYSLEYVFKKLFKKVRATKPMASRHESAEIFVLCQGYLDPAKVDPRFFDPTYVFKELEKETQVTMNILKPLKGKPKAEGYEDGAPSSLFYSIPISEFVNDGDFINILQKASKFEFDDEALKNHKRTTSDIIENCKDIKVLGRKELRALLTWRKRIKADMKKEKEEAEAKQKQEQKEEEKGGEEEDDDKEDKELEELDKQITDMKMEQAQEVKRDRKRKLKEKKKLKERHQLLSAIPGDVGPKEDNVDGLFDIERLAQVENIDTLVDQSADIVVSESEDEGEPERPKYIRHKQGQHVLDRPGKYYSDVGPTEEEEDDDMHSDEEGLGLKDIRLPKVKGRGDPGEDADVSHPLLTDLVGDTKEMKQARKAEHWFSQDVFKGLETEADEDYEVDAAITTFKAKGGEVHCPPEVEQKRLKRLIKKMEKKVEKTEEKEKEKVRKEQDKLAADDINKKKTKKERKKERQMEEERKQMEEELKKVEEERKKMKEEERKKRMEEEGEMALDAPVDSSDDSDSDLDSDPKPKMGPQMPREAVCGGGALDPSNKKRKGEGLDEVGLALATQMVHSKKAKRDMIDAGWNRYMFGDEDVLPNFFMKDEMKYNNPDVQVNPDDLTMYRERNKNVNARTLKKVLEAKARKWRRTKKLMEKARKKAETVTSNSSLSETVMAKEIKKLYTKALAPLKKKETEYVVMKKSSRGMRPRGMKKPYKMVDKRLKKDKRAAQRVEARKLGKKPRGVKRGGGKKAGKR